LALKIFGIDGPTLQMDQPNTNFDYANINALVFFCNTVEDYLFIQLFIEAPAYFSPKVRGPSSLLHRLLTGKGTLDQAHWAWDELLAFSECCSPAR
jgi:hypothetical protein